MRTVLVMGAGNLAHALVQGWSQSPLELRLSVLARSANYQDKGWQAHWAADVGRDPAALAGADTIVLTVKPKDSDEAFKQIRTHARPRTLVISMMAGMPLAHLQAALPSMRVARAMPNIGSAVGHSTTAVAFGPMDLEEQEWGLSLLCALGHTVMVDETGMDGITALSGSGPAYVFVLLAALIEAGTDLGLDPELSRQLALHTLIGAAQVALSSEHLSPEQLIRLVASPGGTTEAALARLEQAQVKEALRQAIGEAGAKAKHLVEQEKA